MTVPLQLGIRAHDLGQVPIEELIERMKKYDFNHAHFAMKKSFPDSVHTIQKMTPGTANYFSSQLNKEGIKISILGSYVNIVASDLEVRKAAIEDFKKHIHLAKDFGASMVATETGSVGKGYTEENFTEEAFQRAVVSVKEMVAEAERFGVIVAIESGINHPVYTAPLAKRLIDEVSSPNLKIILDCANLMSVSNYENQKEVIEEAFHLLDKDIIALHIKDFIVEDGKVKIVPVGHGWMDYEPIMKYAKYEKPHIYTSLEATTEPYLEKSVALIKEIYTRV
ncbi:sugar phosphate isomerase/epimerase [Jeotgalibaca sp. MA1X17-3]|uniref:sugar phosphate isomerase/epimerase family protein n=1 Tax=Jeotgalibaca sp. MA1X17-3 TaxID=2908211 RepID=UPI001F2B889C|nr:sugar phosphate isomerase/epimerase family protein [Jeotgalibaca sp. MA1X17-3]UJF15672.1 sugar phosphate isomerase/epimerase [Jeotgalibaca sp. MA1X17-3]